MQELEVEPRSRPYLLVFIEAIYLKISSVLNGQKKIFNLGIPVKRFDVEQFVFENVILNPFLVFTDFGPHFCARS